MLSYYIIIIKLGDGVAETTKASVAMSTITGSNLGHERHFFADRPDVWSPSPE